MKLKIEEPFPKITEIQINELERYLNCILIKEYKAFLLRNNGGRPNKNLFRTSNGEYETDVQFFYGINGGVYDLKTNFDVFKERIPKQRIPIGTDSLGNQILLDLEKGNVLFFDHEQETETFISDSFNLFLNELFLPEETVNDFDRALAMQNSSFFEELLSKVKSVDEIIDEFGRPLIIVAAVNNKIKLVEFCVKNKANISGALFNASSRGFDKVVKYLLTIGANPNERDKEQNNDTALIQAAYEGSLETVKVLLQFGADINAVDDSGQTAVEKARWSNNQELVDYLEKI